VLRLLLRLAPANKPPTGFLRDIVVEQSGEHRGSVDIKQVGLLPIVGVARYAGLAAGATSTSTVSRLEVRELTGSYPNPTRRRWRRPGGDDGVEDGAPGPAA
jgi:CBS domain-containing protein